METNDEKKARVTFEQPEKRNPEPEAAGQEQEAAEAFLKAMKPQVADFDKHDKVAKVFDYYDMTGFAAQYASQQTASLQKQVELLQIRDEKREVRESNLHKENGGLYAQIESLQKQVEELREKLDTAKWVAQEQVKTVNRLKTDNETLSQENTSLTCGYEQLQAENEQLKSAIVKGNDLSELKALLLKLKK